MSFKVLIFTGEPLPDYDPGEDDMRERGTTREPRNQDEEPGISGGDRVSAEKISKILIISNKE